MNRIKKTLGGSCGEYHENKVRNRSAEKFYFNEFSRKQLNKF